MSDVTRAREAFVDAMACWFVPPMEREHDSDWGKANEAAKQAARALRKVVLEAGAHRSCHCPARHGEDCPLSPEQCAARTPPVDPAPPCPAPSLLREATNPPRYVPRAMGAEGSGDHVAAPEPKRGRGPAEAVHFPTLAEQERMRGQVSVERWLERLTKLVESGRTLYIHEVAELTAAYRAERAEAERRHVAVYENNGKEWDRLWATHAALKAEHEALRKRVDSAVARCRRVKVNMPCSALASGIIDTLQPDIGAGTGGPYEYEEKP